MNKAVERGVAFLFSRQNGDGSWPAEGSDLSNYRQGVTGLMTLACLMGGAGSAIAELLASEGVTVPILHLGLPDAYLDHASREDLLAQSGLDAAGVRAAIVKRWPGIAGSQVRSAAS